MHLVLFTSLSFFICVTMFFLEAIINSGVFVELTEMSAPSGSNKVKGRTSMTPAAHGLK